MDRSRENSCRVLALTRVRRKLANFPKRIKSLRNARGRISPLFENFFQTRFCSRTVARVRGREIQSSALAARSAKRPLAVTGTPERHGHQIPNRPNDGELELLTLRMVFPLAAKKKPPP